MFAFRTNSIVEATGPNNPTLWWEMDETSGNRIDSVEGVIMEPRNGDAGTGPGVGTGRINNAFKLLATNFIAEPAARIRNTADFDLMAPSPSNSVSLAYWVYIDSAAIASMEFDFYRNLDYIGGMYMWVGNGTNQQYCYIEDFEKGYYEDFYITTNIKDSAWHLCVLIWDASSGRLKLSIDDGPFLDTQGGIPMLSGDEGQLVFSRAVVTYEWRVDQVGYWRNRHLTRADITWLYNNGNGRTYSDFS